MKNTIKKFIPTHFFNTNIEEWERINEEGQNWIGDSEWTPFVTNIVDLGYNFKLVIWKELDENDYPVSSLYLGRLETEPSKELKES